MELYLVAVILKPTKKEEEDGAVASVIVSPTAVLAKDKPSALAKALRLVPAEHIDKDARLEPRALPFGA